MRPRPAAIFLVLLVTILLCEMVSRYFISKVFDTPFWEPEKMIFTFYPELLTIPQKLEKDKINILVLGGSAITDTLCHTSENLIKDFAATDYKVAVYNLSRFAHNTLDSRIKFKYCKDLGFDYIFVYNGINDTRTNNCPDDVFRKDYSHIIFYSEVDAIVRHPELRLFTLPFLIDYYWNEMIIKTGWKKVIPAEYVVVNQKIINDDITTKTESNMKAINEFIKKNQDKVIGSDLLTVDSIWWDEGSNIKSAESFKDNLLYIYNYKPPTSKLVLTDYAYYQPADYSLKKFLYGKLDYSEQRWPTEMYGKAENVVKGTAMHDRIIDSVASQHRDIIYFNFNDSIPHTGAYFNDICHLADSGQMLISTILSHHILNDLRSRKPK